MQLEYFQMIDRIESLDLEHSILVASSTVPEASPVFEGHFPGMPLVPGVLLIETMAQASGFLLLAKTAFSAMPFLMAVDEAKFRGFVTPGSALEITAAMEHEGSGYAVTKASITSGGKKVADCQLKLRTLPFDKVPLADIVRKRAGEVGLLTAMSKAAGDRE